MDTQKQNAIMIRDTLVCAQEELHKQIMKNATSSLELARIHDKIWGAIPAAQALVDGVGDGWQDISTAPTNGTPILVGHLVRYLPYKPDGQRQMKAEGRWQEWNGYGWSNIDWEPSRWMPTQPAMKGK